MLYDITPLDPATYVVVAIAFALVAMAASGTCLRGAPPKSIP